MYCELYVGFSGNFMIEFDDILPVRLIVNQLGYEHYYQD